jgi:hypothetical protein
MPKMENAVKHLYAVAVDQCNKCVRVSGKFSKHGWEKVYKLLKFRK